MRSTARSSRSPRIATNSSGAPPSRCLVARRAGRAGRPRLARRRNVARHVARRPFCCADQLPRAARDARRCADPRHACQRLAGFGQRRQRRHENGGPHETPLAYLQRVAKTGDIITASTCWSATGRAANSPGIATASNVAPALLAPGTHGISNAVLDTAWPKLVRKRAELSALLTRDPMPPLERLIDLMRDPRVAPRR